jgi:hypothetical protein
MLHHSSYCASSHMLHRGVRTTVPN